MRVDPSERDTARTWIFPLCPRIHETDLQQRYVARKSVRTPNPNPNDTRELLKSRASQVPTSFNQWFSLATSFLLSFLLHHRHHLTAIQRHRTSNPPFHRAPPQIYNATWVANPSPPPVLHLETTKPYFSSSSHSPFSSSFYSCWC